MSRSKPWARQRSAIRCMRSFILSSSPGSRLRRAFGGEPAARRAELGDGVQQAVLRLRGQVAEQTLGAPRGRLGGVESGGAQRGGPVVAQIDGHHAPVGGGRGAQLGQGAGLEFDDLRLVDLVDDGARRARSAGRRAQSSPDARITACLMPAFVASRKNSSKNLVRTAMLSAMRDMAPADPVAPSCTSFNSLGSNSPLASRASRSTPTARTSGSANGSLISGLSARVAIARAAATMVAVTPTLDARSQVSPS